MVGELITPVFWLGIMGLIFGGGLAYASTIFAIEVDEKVPMIRGVLPGANCGGCGFPGCDGLAAAIVAGDAPVNACPVGGANTAKKVAEIMGLNADLTDRKVARVLCNGKNENCTEKFIYYGVKDCKEAMIASGGSKGCQYGCMGLGTCERICPFDAIHVTADGIAVVDPEKCTACGKCIDACPKFIISLVPASKGVHVDCSSKDKGKDVKDVCTVGCIGCQICVKNCPEKTISFANNLAKIEYAGCTECQICVQKCPTKAINSQLKKLDEAANS
ncbi:MAG: RnfABCDGE type electron transport complex subunit B [Eubacteriaceae bacterium]|nr:RnfABCDGE type electron transport complex subunit B [Eubacteriaceae bacterium]